MEAVMLLDGANSVVYDDKGNIKECIYLNGVEEHWEYDDQDRVIYHYNNCGSQSWCEYNEIGFQFIHSTNVQHGVDSESIQDKEYRIWYHKDIISGYEYWHEYDENGNEIYFKNNQGREEWRTYDKDGIIISIVDNNGDQLLDRYYSEIDLEFMRSVKSFGYDKEDYY